MGTFLEVLLLRFPLFNLTDIDYWIKCYGKD